MNSPSSSDTVATSPAAALPLETDQELEEVHGFGDKGGEFSHLFEVDVRVQEEGDIDTELMAVLILLAAWVEPSLEGEA